MVFPACAPGCLGFSVVNYQNAINCYCNRTWPTLEAANMIANDLSTHYSRNDQLRLREPSLLAPHGPPAPIPPSTAAAAVSRDSVLELFAEQPRIIHPALGLSRIADPSGSCRKRATPAQDAQGRLKGAALQRTCYICSKYYERKRWSAFICANCGACICKMGRRRVDSKRKLTCWQEHLLACDGAQRKNFPKGSQLWRFGQWNGPRPEGNF